jgi:hypothetical protein
VSRPDYPNKPQKFHNCERAGHQYRHDFHEDAIGVQYISNRFPFHLYLVSNSGQDRLGGARPRYCFWVAFIQTDALAEIMDNKGTKSVLRSIGTVFFPRLKSVTRSFPL